MLALTVVLTVLTAAPAAVEQPAESRSAKTEAAVETPALLQTLVGDRNFAAASSDEAPHEAEPDAKVAVTPDSELPSVTGIARSGESGDSLTLHWDRAPGVDDYRVYWRDLVREDDDYRLFTTAHHTGLKIRNLRPGAKYSFLIAAVVRDEDGVREGEATEAVFATVPGAVSGFVMSGETKDKTTLKWDAVASVDGYLLERRCEGEWSDWQTLDADVTELTDSELTAGKVYDYRLSAYREDDGGRICGESAAVRTVAGLLGPKDDGSFSKLGRVSLDYKKSAYADGYEIHYAKEDDDWALLADTTKTHCSTSWLEDGATYRFRIYPYRKIDGEKITGAYTEIKLVAQTAIYGQPVGDTYVEVNLKAQHMWYIVNSEVYLESDCVTGNYGSADTPKGFWYVNNKVSPCTLKGEDYETRVTYWMPFIGGGWGLHDASWRSKFGGNIYKGDGSHGCVNLPTKIAKKMYAKMEIGTPVIVY